MATRYDNVIVFGPTGAVGSVAALEASKRGAKVWLAMRDPTKKIPGLTSEQEQSGSFTRVQADLSNPESVKAAIELSGAKAAFVYLIHTPGGVKPALQAMKESGVEYVVFLSSFTIKQGVDIRSVTPDAVIPFVHAQGEIALEDVGLAHAALRPGSFASNPFNIGMDAKKTPPEIYAYGDGARMVDNIVPKDIGRVAGAVLVDRPSGESKEIIYLFGPKLMSDLETCNAVKEFSGQEIKVVQQTHDEWLTRMRASGFPEGLLAYFGKVLKEPDLGLYGDGIAEEGAKNITRFSGYEPTRFEEFVRARNKP